MRKKSATLQYSTWSKIFNLANSDNDLDKTYSEILAAVIDYRVKLGITQNELAKRSGLTSSMISKFESQNSVPSIKNFLKYLKGLDLYLEFIHKKIRLKKPFFRLIFLIKNEFVLSLISPSLKKLGFKPSFFIVLVFLQYLV